MVVLSWFIQLKKGTLHTWNNRLFHHRSSNILWTWITPMCPVNDNDISNAESALVQGIAKAFEFISVLFVTDECD